VVTNPLGTITYTYDATGDKLRKVSVQSGTTKTTDYISGIEYDNSTTVISFIQAEEGKAVPNDATAFDYNYYLGDNLGNTRVTFGTKTGAAVLYQQDDYYPFGLEINRTPYIPKNEYLYNKKELQEEFTEYDYGARPYDDRGSRFLSVDPMSRKYPWYTPYQFSGNSPIKFIDLDGLEPANNPTQPDVSEALGMKVVDGIATTAALNAIKKEGRSKEIQGSEVETGKDDFITDTDPQSAKQFNMYVNNSSVFKVDESNANKFNDYSGAVVSVLLSNFVTGKGPENVEFPVNGIISSKFLQSDILHNALKDYLAKPVGRSQQYPFGFKELTNDLKRNGTLFSMTGLVGSGMITIEPTADGIKIKIFNITSLTSGSLGKELFPQDSWPHSYVRAYKTITPYGNISQTFNLFIPNANIKKVYDSFK